MRPECVDMYPRRGNSPLETPIVRTRQANVALLPLLVRARFYLFFCFFFLSYPLLEAFDQIARARICWDGQFLCDDENDTLVTQVGHFCIFYFFFLTLIPTSALNSDYETGT